jgi:hypothetical protein
VGFIDRRSQLVAGAGLLIVAGGIAGAIALALGGTSSPPKQADYLARVQAICEKYARKLDRIPPPADIATPAEIIYSVGAALPILKEQTAKARAVPVPTALQPLVERFFENSQRSLDGLDEALESAKASDFGGLGHGYVQFLRARSAAAAEAAAIGFSC